MVSNIYDVSQIFYDNYEYYCFKNCFLNVLKFYGFENAEYFIECSMDWTFSKVEESEDKFGYQFSTGNPYSSLLNPFDQAVNYLSKNEASIGEIWKMNKKSMDENIPVIVQVDVFYLKYTPYYKKKHSFHSLIMAEYKERENEVSIIDWYKPWYFKGKIKLEELNLARDSQNEYDGLFSGNPINYLYAEINSEELKREKISTLKLIEKSVQDNLVKYYTGRQENNVYKGYYAINEIAKLIENNKCFDLEKKAEFLEDLYNKLYFVPTRKKLFLWYLERINKDFSLIYVEQVKLQLRDSINLWKVLLSLIIKCSMSNDDRIYENILIKIREIVMKEKQYYYTLYEFSKLIRE